MLSLFLCGERESPSGKRSSLEKGERVEVQQPSEQPASPNLSLLPTEKERKHEYLMPRGERGEREGRERGERGERKERERRVQQQFLPPSDNGPRSHFAISSAQPSDGAILHTAPTLSLSPLCLQYCNPRQVLQSPFFGKPFREQALTT